jgi:hypothetical protein
VVDLGDVVLGALGGLERDRVEIGRGDAEQHVVGPGARGREERHHHGVGLLARRTAGGPGAHGVVPQGRLGGEDRWDDLAADDLPDGRVAEEVGDVHRERIQQPCVFGRLRRQVGTVFAVGRKPERTHAGGETTLDVRFPVLREIDPTVALDLQDEGRELSACSDLFRVFHRDLPSGGVTRALEIGQVYAYDARAVESSEPTCRGRGA